MSDTESNLDPNLDPRTIAALEAEIIEKEATALSLRGPTQELAKVAAPLTAQQARVHEVADVLGPAYARASTLELTDEEIAALQAQFADEYVEIRPNDGLIYIPHIHISNRLNAVIKPGRWATICRRHWVDKQMAERMVDGKKTIVDVTTMYGEYVLVIRGCYVGESIGGHPYVASNPKTNYSDALESTRAEALRRICAKSLGVGSQVWDPEYSRRWVQTYAYQQHGKWHKKASPQGGSPPPPPAAPPGSSPSPQPKRAAAGPPSNLDAVADAANATRERRTVGGGSNAGEPVKAAPSRTPDTAPGHACPKCRSTATKESEDWEAVRWCQRCGWQWTPNGQYFEGHDWAKVICPIPPKGVKLMEYRSAPQTLGQIARLDNKRWFGLVMNVTVEETAKGRDWNGKHYPATAADLAFAKACEDAKTYMDQQGGEQDNEERDQSGDQVPF